MSDTELIRVEGRSEPEAESADRRLPVVTGLVGLGLGVALAATFSPTPSSEPAEDPAPAQTQVVSPDPIPSTPTTVQTAAEPTLADLAPMLTTDLIGIGTDIRGSSTAERWRLTAESPTALDLPSGAVFTDMSDRWLALFTQARYSDDLALWVGNPVYAEPLSAAVVGAVWSSDQAATIAWTERRESSEVAETVLFTQGLTGSNLIARTEAVVPGFVQPMWFTSAGIVVIDQSDMLSLVTPQGEIRATLEIDRFYAATDRYALLDIDGQNVLVSPTLEVIAPFTVDVSGCAVGRFAPPTTDPFRRFAIGCQYPEGQIFLHAWEIAEGADGLEIAQIGSLPQLNLSAFSWASRDVLVAPLPVNSGRPETLVTVWDVDSGESELVRWPGLIYNVVPAER